MADLWIFGAGGHAKVVIGSARAAGRYTVAGILDDDPDRMGSAVLGVPILGTISAKKIALHEVRQAVIAIGANDARTRIAERLEGFVSWATVVHPRAVIAPGVCLGEGTVVFAGTVVQPDTVIGDHVILNTGCSVDHDCRIADYAHVGPGSRLAGEVRVGRGAMLGIGSAVIPGCTIGDWAVVGAGGIVIGDIPARVVAKGVPARYDDR